MRFIFSLIVLMILIALIIIPLYFVSYFDIGFIGRGENIQNIIFYVLEQDPNMAGEERLWNAEDLLLYGVKPLLISLTIVWFASNIFWMGFSEFLKIDRPNKAFKYLGVWIAFFAATILISSFLTYYLLYSQKSVYQYVGGPQITFLIILTAVITSVFYYLSSLFVTSRVTRSAVPLANVLMRT